MDIAKLDLIISWLSSVWKSSSSYFNILTSFGLWQSHSLHYSSLSFGTKLRNVFWLIQIKNSCIFLFRIQSNCHLIVGRRPSCAGWIFSKISFKFPNRSIWNNKLLMWISCILREISLFSHELSFFKYFSHQFSSYLVYQICLFYILIVFWWTFFIFSIS